MRPTWCFILVLALIGACSRPVDTGAPLLLSKGSRIVLLGNNLGSRMTHYGHFETELHMRYPDSLLFIRNLCDPGDTPGFRPHAGRPTPWAFPGAEAFHSELAQPSGSEGHFPYPDEWLSNFRTDIIIAFFGYNESFDGPAGLERFKGELDAFIRHTLTTKYNGHSAPQLAVVSPIAFEDLSALKDLPDGRRQNTQLSLYTKAMAEVCADHGVRFIDAWTPSRRWYAAVRSPLTIDGFQFNDAGYRQFAMFLADKLFGEVPRRAERYADLIRDAVNNKNWMWLQDYKIPNGVHVFGRRYEPFGPDNYPAELQKIRQLTAIRDEAIWRVAKGDTLNLYAADTTTLTLPAVATNYEHPEEARYLYGEDALKSFNTAPGYKIELFASEQEFEDLANPVQLSFDNKGRLWIATMPSYPHYRVGDSKPNDKLIILEDTDGDGKADHQITFADGLHLPVGFELAPEGVYVSQGTDLVLLKDTDGDDRADAREVLLSGFDDHDTHHAHSAYTADPSGAIYMAEGVFLHTNVETPYGPVRATNGGFYRYDPNRHHLERTAQLSIPNPWGIAFDDWGQPIFAETSGPDVLWMLPGTIKPRYGVETPKSRNLIQSEHRVRPTSGLEFVSSRHFPEEVQGDFLINNTIGFLGTKQHTFTDDGTGFKSRHRLDLVWSDDKNFRPVDMEFAPDGSLYIVDWHNVLVGHMQHNARDPLRDHVHGRIYRITYPSRPLVTPPNIHGASIPELLDNLKLPEYRTRYRTRRELRGRNADEVLRHIKSWVANLDVEDPGYEHHLLEALWVTWGLNRVDDQLLHRVMQANDFRARAAAVRVARYAGHRIKQQTELLKKAAADPHGRVRLEAIVAASWLDKDAGSAVLEEAGKHPLDDWMLDAYETAIAHLEGRTREERAQELIVTNLKGNDQTLYLQGKEIYNREGFCATCHQPDGGGLPSSGFPPLRQTPWVTGSEERLIKLVMKGMQGPLEINGTHYPGQVPMTPFEGLLNDEEIAAVLTYVRNSFGNQASPVDPALVKKIREEVRSYKGFYSAQELTQYHPLER